MADREPTAAHSLDCASRNRLHDPGPEGEGTFDERDWYHPPCDCSNAALSMDGTSSMFAGLPCDQHPFAGLPYDQQGFAGDPTAASCPECGRGREACQYCEAVEQRDWEAICDCGLYDFGVHILRCEDRAAFKYVIAADYAAAELPRA